MPSSSRRSSTSRSQPASTEGRNERPEDTWAPLIRPSKERNDDDEDDEVIGSEDGVTDGTSSTIGAREIATGYSRMKHTVHDGALQMPEEVVNGIMSKIEKKALETDGIKPLRKYKLPGLDSVQRPCLDPNVKRLKVTELSIQKVQVSRPAPPPPPPTNPLAALYQQSMNHAPKEIMVTELRTASKFKIIERRHKSAMMTPTPTEKPVVAPIESTEENKEMTTTEESKSGSEGVEPVRIRGGGDDEDAEATDGAVASADTDGDMNAANNTNDNSGDAPGGDITTEDKDTTKTDDTNTEMKPDAPADATSPADADATAGQQKEEAEESIEPVSTNESTNPPTDGTEQQVTAEQSGTTDAVETSEQKTEETAVEETTTAEEGKAETTAETAADTTTTTEVSSEANPPVASEPKKDDDESKKDDEPTPMDVDSPQKKENETDDASPMEGVTESEKPNEDKAADVAQEQPSAEPTGVSASEAVQGTPIVDGSKDHTKEETKTTAVNADEDKQDMDVEEVKADDVSEKPNLSSTGNDPNVTGAAKDPSTTTSVAPAPATEPSTEAELVPPQGTQTAPVTSSSVASTNDTATSVTASAEATPASGVTIPTANPTGPSLDSTTTTTPTAAAVATPSGAITQPATGMPVGAPKPVGSTPAIPPVAAPPVPLQSAATQPVQPTVQPVPTTSAPANTPTQAPYSRTQIPNPSSVPSAAPIVPTTTPAHLSSSSGLSHTPAPRVPVQAPIPASGGSTSVQPTPLGMLGRMQQPPMMQAVPAPGTAPSIHMQSTPVQSSLFTTNQATGVAANASSVPVRAQPPANTAIAGLTANAGQPVGTIAPSVPSTAVQGHNIENRATTGPGMLSSTVTGVAIKNEKLPLGAPSAMATSATAAAASDAATGMAKVEPTSVQGSQPAKKQETPPAQVLPDKLAPQWEAVKPAAAKAPAPKVHPRPDWYKKDKVARVERDSLPEWFDGSAPHRTPKTYLEAREKIMQMSDTLVNRNITNAMIRRAVIGDAGSLHRLRTFLVNWDMINQDAMNESAPTPASLRSGAVPSSSSSAAAATTTSSKRRFDKALQGDLIQAVVQQSKRRKDDSENSSTSGATFIPIDWEEVAEVVGHGASPEDCQRNFMMAPLKESAQKARKAEKTQAERPITPEASADSSQTKQMEGKEKSSSKTNTDIQLKFVEGLVDRTDPAVLQKVLSAAMEATGGDLAESQSATVLGLQLPLFIAEAKKHEIDLAAKLSELVDQRMKKLENRMSMMDEVEGILEAEKVALELERRDLYTARCRHWFGGT